jgi:hypothetical protein
MDALAPLEVLFPSSSWVGSHIALAHYSMRDLGITRLIFRCIELYFRLTACPEPSL